jgi:4a-hydroxytetrahydrobiopterin dehydratase
MPKLSSAEVKEGMSSLPEWRKRGQEITRTFEFKDFAEAMKFVNKVAKAAEKANHHPDIDIRWNKVTLALSTHSEGGLTSNDFDMAKKIDKI